MIIQGVTLGILALILLYISFIVDFRSKSRLINIIFIVMSLAVIFCCYLYTLKILENENNNQIKDAKEYHGIVVDHAAREDGYILFIEAGGKTEGYEVTKKQFLEHPVHEEVIIKVFKDELKSITTDNDSKE